MAVSGAPLNAQTSQTSGDQSGAALSEIRDSVIRVLSADKQTVEVTANRHLITISRINSSMNRATHGERNMEATAIASTVVAAISEKPEFKNVLSIQVQYSAQPAPGARKGIVDNIEFRKDRAGKFQLHGT
jgi:hypothetical protein